MASQKYPWKKIKKDYYDKKYSTLKKLAEAYGIKYSYLRKQSSKWPKSNPEIISDLDIEEEEKALRLPEDRKERVRLMYDKLCEIVFIALNNPEGSLMTMEGHLKTKQFLDVVTAVEKIDKGYATGEDSKQMGQLSQYSDYLKGLREQYLDNKEDNQDE